MNIILEKDGKTFEYKTGNALYLLFSFVPAIGNLIALCLMIIRKQFRGVYLNQLLLLVIYVVLARVTYALGITFLFQLINSLFVILFIYMTVMYILNANYYSIRQRLDEGYTVVNGDNPDVEIAVNRARNIRKPFWQITKF